jgi:hypothetical protein
MDGMNVDMCFHPREGNKDFVMVGEHSLINFEKRRKVAIVLTRLQQVRSSGFIISSPWPIPSSTALLTSGALLV